MNLNILRHIVICCFFLLALIVSITGCGVYSFSGHGIGGVETIAIESFENQTAEFGIREELSDAILNALLKDRTLTVVDRSNADAILFGNILSIRDNPLTYDQNETVSEYEISISMSFVLRDPEKTDPVWQGTLTGKGSYPFTSGGTTEREEGMDKALDRLAQDLLNKLTSDW